jgi:hypothetical protein
VRRARGWRDIWRPEVEGCSDIREGVESDIAMELCVDVGDEVDGARLKWGYINR